MLSQGRISSVVIKDIHVYIIYIHVINMYIHVMYMSVACMYMLYTCMYLSKLALDRYLGLFGDHIVPAVLYRHGYT